MSITIELAEEWRARHSIGGRPVEVGNELVFPDGASCSAVDGGGRREPPVGEFDRLQRQRRYWQKRLDQAVEDFGRVQSSATEMLANASTYSASVLPLPVAAPQQLRAIREAVGRCREKLREIDAQLGGTPEAKLQAERAEQHRRRQAEIGRLHAEVLSVTLNGGAERPALDSPPILAQETTMLVSALVEQVGAKSET